MASDALKNKRGGNMDLDVILARGEPARLFPVLADTSVEGRATSILLACMEVVPHLADIVLSQISDDDLRKWAKNEGYISGKGRPAKRSTIISAMVNKVVAGMVTINELAEMLKERSFERM